MRELAHKKKEEELKDKGKGKLQEGTGTSERPPPIDENNTSAFCGHPRKSYHNSSLSLICFASTRRTKGISGGQATKG